MISICIPVYNTDVNDLVQDLLKQNVNFDYEIILIDDASKLDYQKKNKTLNFRDKVSYIQLEKNIGRAKIRNLFLNYVNYENLLFLDCDARVLDGIFLFNYSQNISQNKVIYGGRKYQLKFINRDYNLRFKYSIKKENINYNFRNSKPYISFQSNNFLVSKKIFQKIKFQEYIINYGHEDTLFGFELKQNKVQITHIDNPITTFEIEDNITFLNKTKTSIKTLVLILQKIEFNQEFIDYIPLLKAYNKVKKFKFILSIYFKLFNKPIYYLLKKGFYNTALFSFYKLGYLNKQLNGVQNKK